MKYINLLILLFTLLSVSCENWLCTVDKEDEIVISQYESLDFGIDGTLYFVGGPSIYDIDTTSEHYYHDNYWDFWKLEGSEFSKINEGHFNHFNTLWGFKWSPKANYFSFFNDMGGEVPNTDEIGTLNLSTLEEFYLTDNLGDANPGDQCVFNWSPNEEYIYFTALEYGVSEYEETANSDIYRIKIDGTDLENLTNSPYFEMVVTPSPDGTKLAYIVDNKNNTPESVQGYYIMDMNTGDTQMIMNIPYDLYAYGDYIKWHPSSEFLLFISERTDPNRILYYNIRNSEYFFLPAFQGQWYLRSCTFINGTNNALLWVKSNTHDEYYNYIKNHNFYLYDFDTRIKYDLTNYMSPFEETFWDISYWGDIVSSPDGKYIAFAVSENKYFYPEETPEYPMTDELGVKLTRNIFLLNLDTHELTQLTHGTNTWEGYLKWVE